MYFRKEKLCLTTLIFFFIALYISFSFFIVRKIRNQKELFWGQFENNYFQWIGFFQMFYVLILNRVGLNMIFNLQSFFICGIEMKPKRSKLYSAIKFLRFSEKIEIVFLIVRFIALVFKNICSTHIFFHVDLVLFCIYMFNLFFTKPYRHHPHIYHGIYTFAFNIILICHLGVWICYLLLFSQPETIFYSSSEISFNWPGFVSVLIAKVLVLYFYMTVFIPRLLLPLLLIKFQPVFFRRQDVSYSTSMAVLLFYIAEMFLIPIALLFIEIMNR